MKMDRKECEAVVRLMHNEDFRVFLGALARQTEKLNERLIMANLNDVELRNIQGQTKAMAMVMKAIEEAPSVLSNQNRAGDV